MKTDNELIAEFMGIKCSAVGETAYDNGRRLINVAELEYDERWDWLMPVVEKIEVLIGQYTTRIHFNADEGIHFCDIVDVENYEVACQKSDISKIDAVYKAVVEFIKWYNENKSV